MKRTSLFLLSLMLFLSGCEAEDPTRLEQIRAKKMFYGDRSYRTLEYDKHDKLVRIIFGLIADGQVDESVYSISYNDDLIDKILLGDDWRIEYNYENGRVTESREVAHDIVTVTNTFDYDIKGRVTSVLIRVHGDRGFTPWLKTDYEYNTNDNAIAMKQYVFDEDEREYIKGLEVEYEDFDKQRNSLEIFSASFANLYMTNFRNNPRLWRVRQTNGTVGEIRYDFEYNDQGYATRQTPRAGGHPITFSFESY
jgi:hypothetical protein